jgi:creatinine amidohydrolase/Fe(II)-dependent formamide hydrolase-like protein
MSDHDGPWRLKTLLPSEAAARLAACPLLLVPVGGTAVQSAALPLGTDTLLVERIADDVSSRRGLVRAPALEYGVHDRGRALFGGAALRRKTLHRVINEVIDSWETGGGVRHFVLLTALASEAHFEALSTVRVESATVTTVDIFALDFASRLASWGPEERLGELVTSLMLYLFPTLVRPDALGDAPTASVEIFSGGAARAAPETGRVVYDFMLERILHLVDAVLAGR